MLLLLHHGLYQHGVFIAMPGVVNGWKIGGSRGLKNSITYGIGQGLWLTQGINNKHISIALSERGQSHQ